MFDAAKDFFILFIAWKAACTAALKYSHRQHLFSVHNFAKVTFQTCLTNTVFAIEQMV